MPGVVKMRIRTRVRGSTSFPENEDTVYTKKGRERRISEGQMRNWEDGFMMGHLDGFF